MNAKPEVGFLLQDKKDFTSECYPIQYPMTLLIPIWFGKKVVKKTTTPKTLVAARLKDKV